MSIQPATGTGAKIPPYGSYPVTWLQSQVMAIGSALPNNWAGLRLSGWLRALLCNTAAQPVDVTRLGSRMRLHLTDNACERRLMVTPQFFDPVDLQVLKSAIKPGFAFVDLGANVGTYSLFVAHHGGPITRILAVEPMPAMIERLSSNIELNAYTGITVCPYAISTTADSEIELHLDTNNYGATSFRPLGRVRGTRTSHKVRATTLWALVQQHNLTRIDALKADLEGAEDIALIPYLSAAPRELWPRLLILEDNHRTWSQDLTMVLRQRGWEPVPCSSKNLILALRD